MITKKRYIQKNDTKNKGSNSLTLLNYTTNMKLFKNKGIMRVK